MFGLGAYAEIPYATGGAGRVLSASISESATASDSIASLVTFASAVSETATAADSVAALAVFGASVRHCG
ncbi:hypothetical protein EBT31_21465 [bacterium]|nr:hypothetical protein [bacterium]